MREPTIKALVPEVIKDLEKGISFCESIDRLRVPMGRQTLLKHYVQNATTLPLGEPRRHNSKRKSKWGNEAEEIEEPTPLIFATQRIDIKKVEVKGKTYYDVTPLIIDCGA